jgi:Skp family chaperone for outer membrane proteins
MKSKTSQHGGLRWYEILYALILLLLLFFGLVINKPARVGVIDIAAVMDELGISDALTEHGRNMQGEIGRDIQELQNEYAANLASITSQMTSAESDEATIQGQVATLQTDLRRATTQLVTSSQRRQQAVLAEFRGRLQPYINQVSEKKGVSLVATKGSHLAYYRSTISLTDAVIDAARPDAEKLAQPIESGDAE